MLHRPGETMKREAGLLLPLSTGGYLSVQAFGSVFVNGGINFAFAWPMRRALAVPVFGGVGSAFLDTCATTVLLSAFTVIFGSLFVKRDVRIGIVRPLPRSHRDYPLLRRFSPRAAPRALVFAAMFGALGIPIGLALLARYHGGSMTFVQFATFKVLFASLLGIVVTPLNAAVVLSPDSGHA
jgi:hypothetical protein